MQLPRGTFQSIRKSISIVRLIEEAMDAQFSGYLSFVLGGEKCTIVMDGGKWILLELGSLCGKEAFERLRALDNPEVDAEVIALTPVQLELARQYNKAAAWQVSFVSAQPVQKRMETPRRESARESPARKTAEKGVQAANTVPLQKVSPDSDDLALLDSMDLEKITEKMRANSKLIAEKLELDHLVKERGH